MMLLNGYDTLVAVDSTKHDANGKLFIAYNATHYRFCVRIIVILTEHRNIHHAL